MRHHSKDSHRIIIYYTIILILNTLITTIITTNSIFADQTGHQVSHSEGSIETISKLTSAGKYSDAKNYASAECAKVIETNPEAKKAPYMLNELIDEYMLNPCKTRIWFVIELCEAIQATRIELANYELFSSTPQDFTVYFSDTYPALDWKLVGVFKANDSRTLQAFDLNQVGFGKFIRVELHSHYGNEHYCPISQVRVFGASMAEEYEKTESQERHKKLIKKYEPKTSAFRVYHNMMIEPYVCGLTRSMDKNDSAITLFDKTVTSKEKKNPHQPNNIIHNIPQPTPQPAVVNRTAPLKPSIFVDLSNKVKALETLCQDLSNKMKAMETSLKTRIEENDRRTDSKLDKLTLQCKLFTLIGIALLVYKIMLDLM